MESQTAIVAVGAVVRFFTWHLTIHARAEEPNISITSLLKWLSSGIPISWTRPDKGSSLFSEKVEFQLYSDTFKWRFPEMEVALFIHFSLGFSIKNHPAIFFGTPMTSQWTPGHPQITGKISPSTPSFSLTLYGELESRHPGRLTLWLGCRRWRQVVQ